MTGFITIERKLWDHPIFAPSPMSEREAWVWMISRAAWSDTEHFVGGQMRPVSRGSFMVTLREMQSAFMWGSDKKVRNFLKKLENHEMLTGETVGQRNARKTHVTICNYDEYQSSGRSKDAPKTHGGRTKDAVKNKVTKEQDKKEEEANASSLPAASKSNGSRLPDEWFLPVEYGEWAVSQGWPVAVIRLEADKFKDYWIGIAGAKATKRNWFATWRNWMRHSTSPKAINGGLNERSNNNTSNDQHGGLTKGQERSNATLENIARLAQLR